MGVSLDSVRAEEHDRLRGRPGAWRVALDALDATDGTVIAKKRFLLGHGLPDVDEAYHGHTKDTAKAEGDMEFWLPKAANRFSIPLSSLAICGRDTVF